MKTNKSRTLPGDQLVDSDFDSWYSPSASTQVDLDEKILNLTPEELVWAAALQQAIEDACLPETSLAPNSDKTTKNAYSSIEINRRSARAFIFSVTAETSSHFHDMCDVLGLNPQYVRKKVSEFIRQGITFKRTIGVDEE